VAPTALRAASWQSTTLGRARRVPDRAANQRHVRALADKSQRRSPGPTQVTASVIEAFLAMGHQAAHWPLPSLAGPPLADGSPWSRRLAAPAPVHRIRPPWSQQVAHLWSDNWSATHVRHL